MRSNAFASPLILPIVILAAYPQLILCVLAYIFFTSFPKITCFMFVLGVALFVDKLGKKEREKRNENTV